MYNLIVTLERNNQEVPPDVKARKRAERFAKGNTNGGMIEVDHIKPRYAGGTNDEENLDGKTRPEHAKKHFVHAHDTPPGQVPDAEWAATRYIVGRMKLDEFTDFLTEVEPMIPQLREDLKKKRGKRG